MRPPIVTGEIKPIWKMKEVALLDYFYEPFNDPKTVDKWKKIYNQEFSTGMQADYRSKQPRCQEAVFESIREQGHELTNQAFSWYRMRPGDIIPEHADTYINYCQRYNIKQKQAVRILVLLQPWNPGFLLEVDGRSFSHYPAGTWVMWHADTPHMAGNLSSIPRYTLQITATRS